MGVFDADGERAVRDMLAGLEREVELVLVHGPEPSPLPGARDIDFAGETEKLLRALEELSDVVSVRVTDESWPGVDRHPAVIVLADAEDTGIRYCGLPWGYELASLVGAVREAGKGESSLRDESLAVLDGLERDVSIDVFVTPT
jgi:alkyl hydroperoxide reductase subunit AhpF